MARNPAPNPSRCRHIDLALQGGGAHGAFSWGVLDRLLEDDRIQIDAISGASAGALNAVVLASGLALGRRQARDALRRFWSRVSSAAVTGSPMLALFRDWSGVSPAGWYVDWLTRTFSPYQFNPMDINPLRDIVADEVDFERVRGFAQLQLFVSATNVRTGELKEFRGHEISLEAVMASACLPTLFRAVQIGSEAYWDGGYVGNPSLLPLIADSPAHDLLLVQINPSSRPTLPTRPQEILDRLNEITFNASVVKELRTIGLLKSLLRAEGLPPSGARAPLFRQIAALRLHRIHAEEEMARLGAASKMNAAWPLVQNLHRIGREAAHSWLERNFTHLGRRGTMVVEEQL